MTNEKFDRRDQQGRAMPDTGLHRFLLGAGRSLMVPFERLQAIQFAAPWTRARRDRHADAHCA